MLKNSQIWSTTYSMVDNRKKLMGTLDFFKESIKNFKTSGTITRSSKFLCKQMIKPVDFQKSKLIIELGAGDGVITKHILSKMSSDSKLMVFEVNNKFVSILNKINDERLIVIQDSAENLEQYMSKHGVDQIDYVISAIPFVIIPKEIVANILEACKKKLKPGGLFVQMHYSLLAKNLYESAFGNVEISFVPLNIPPAFVMVSQNN